MPEGRAYSSVGGSGGGDVEGVRSSGCQAGANLMYVNG